VLAPAAAAAWQAGAAHLQGEDVDRCVVQMGCRGITCVCQGVNVCGRQLSS
jgi:hypothetical protein